MNVFRLLRLTHFPARIYFNLLYLVGYTPWETENIPDELDTLLKSGLTPGLALDIGCGTGNNLIHLAKLGWNSTGLDVSDMAVWLSQRNARKHLVHNKVEVFRSHILNWQTEQKYDLVLDVGCFVGLPPEEQFEYVHLLGKLVRSPSGSMCDAGGVLLLFAFPPRIVRGTSVGIPSKTVTEIFQDAFYQLVCEEGVWDGLPVTWYLFAKK